MKTIKLKQIEGILLLAHPLAEAGGGKGKTPDIWEISNIPDEVKTYTVINKMNSLITWHAERANIYSWAWDEIKELGACYFLGNFEQLKQLNKKPCL